MKKDTIDHTNYVCICDESGEYEEVTGLAAAKVIADGMLHDLQYNMGTEDEDVYVRIFKLDSEIGMKCNTNFTYYERKAINGICK